MSIRSSINVLLKLKTLKNVEIELIEQILYLRGNIYKQYII